jgi:hypothetical protein
MFFRRKRPSKPTFDERLDVLKSMGFTVERLEGGRACLRRGRCAAIAVEDAILRAGIETQGQIAALVDGGYQKFLELPGGSRQPALAAQLKELHDFEEDLRAGLGLASLYNTALGTTFDRHSYDGLQK